MAEEQATSVVNEKSRSDFLGKLIIAGFMAGVLAVECLLAFVLIPSADEVAVLAEQKMTEKLPSTLISGEPNPDEKETKATVEVDLGEYSVSVTQPNSNLVIRVDFHLVGITPEEDQKELQSMYDRKIHRFRDQILFEIRNSELADLADPGLGLIKRRILEKSNDLFGKTLLRSVVFSQFSFIEQ